MKIIGEFELNVCTLPHTGDVIYSIMRLLIYIYIYIYNKTRSYSDVSVTLIAHYVSQCKH